MRLLVRKVNFKIMTYFVLQKNQLGNLYYTLGRLYSNKDNDVNIVVTNDLEKEFEEQVKVEKWKLIKQ